MSALDGFVGSPAVAGRPGRVTSAGRSLRHHLLAGAVVVIALVGGLGTWAAMTEIAGAVVASGSVVVDSSSKKVQHPTGGVVGELLVRDGDRVEAGDVVIRLDATVAQANLSMVSKSLNELAAREARLAAERDDRPAIEFPASLLAAAGSPGIARTIDGETRLFELRRTARQGQRAQLAERIGQLKEEVLGLTGQAAAKRREVELINRELEGVRELWRKNLVQIQRVTQLEREAVRLDGERNQLIATVAQTRGKMTETELQILQVDQELRSEVAKELREIQAKSAELVERRIAAQDQLMRIDLRAPQRGVVHQLAAHTVGGVIAPGDALMLIVPEEDKLVVEARLPPQNIDQVTVGQKTTLRFSAFNQRTTPEIEGYVVTVSADVSVDAKTGAAFYVARIALPEEQVARLGNLKLVPGIPVEAFIRTDDRTILSYLLKPLEEQVARSFRER